MLVSPIVITLLLAAHLLCVNVASGGPIVAAWLDWRGTRGDEAAAKAAKYLGGWALAGLIGGALLGVAVGWLKWDADYRALWLGPLSYKLHWAALEALFSLVLIAGWWWWLPARAGGSRGQAVTRIAIAALAATNLLYHFPVLFSVASRLSDAGLTSGERIGGAAFRRLMAGDETPAVAVHVVLASLAVAGIVLLGLALKCQRRGEPARAARIARWGGWWSLAPSVAQLPVGLWTLTALPSAAQSKLMGASAAGILLLVLALAAALWLVNELVHVSLGELARPVLIRAMTAMLVTVVLMTALQQHTRPTPQKTSPALQEATP